MVDPVKLAGLALGGMGGASGTPAAPTPPPPPPAPAQQAPTKPQAAAQQPTFLGTVGPTASSGGKTLLGQ